MALLSRMFYSQLPVWARPTHPMMRYALGYRKLTLRDILVRMLLAVLVVGIMVAAGYVYTSETSDSSTVAYREFMFYPLVVLQLFAQLAALSMTVNSVALERQRGTWETLQVSLVGAATAIRSRWALVFYRLRWILAAMVLGRLGYIALLMGDMTDFEGRAIDVRIIGISPEVTLEVAVFLLTALITAAILLPFVAIALDAAIGMLISTLTQRRSVGILTSLILVGGRILVTASALFLGETILTANGTKPEIVEMSTTEGWVRTVFLTLQGDLGLRLLNLETLGNLWADLENGIYLGGVVLVGTILMAVIGNGFVLFAARRAAKPAQN